MLKYHAQNKCGLDAWGKKKNNFTENIMHVVTAVLDTYSNIT
jgi:hypothetical protein